jgi:cytochrome c-type biogenesis protein
MMLALSFFAGALTNLSPCVLPLIPILLGSALQKHPVGPLALALGLSLSFATLGVLFASAGFVFGIDASVLRVIAAAMMAGFGIVLLSRPLQDRLALAGAPLTNRLQGRFGTLDGSGLFGQFALGVLLGVVWSPCAGPTLGAAVGLAASTGTAPRAAVMMMVFGLGAIAPVLALAYGSRRWLQGGRRGLRLIGAKGKSILGAALLVIGLVVLTGSDKRVETALVAVMPDWLVDLASRI